MLRSEGLQYTILHTGGGREVRVMHVPVAKMAAKCKEVLVEGLQRLLLQHVVYASALVQLACQDIQISHELWFWEMLHFLGYAAPKEKQKAM